ncbi:uncharacterized protein P7C70_g5986, partial [Phenoliferia sp. Uapishka_3]
MATTEAVVLPTKEQEARRYPSHHEEDNHHYASSVNPRYDPLENNEQPFLPVFHRHRADPAPLGFMALGSGLFVISIVAMGADGLSSLTASTAVVLMYCAIAELVAGIWEFPTGNSWGAAFFMSLSGLFASTAYILSPWSEISRFTIGAHRGSGGLLCCLVFVDLFLLMIGLYYYYVSNIHLLTAAGAFGIIASFVAYYAALSTMLTEHSSSFRLPVLLDLRDGKPRTL